MPDGLSQVRKASSSYPSPMRKCFGSKIHSKGKARKHNKLTWRSHCDWRSRRSETRTGRIVNGNRSGIHHSYSNPSDFEREGGRFRLLHNYIFYVR